jgi:hypothetical protein
MTRPSILGAQIKMANAYGLSVDEVHNALSWARIAKAAEANRPLPASEPPRPERRAQWDFARVPEPKDGKTYCGQCDRRVSPDESARCLDSFCKAMAIRFVGECISRREADKARLDSPPASDSLGVSR